jgi:hypothetical protein
VTQIHRPARLATRAASFRSGGRHHSGIPGDIIPLYPGDFVGIRSGGDRRVVPVYDHDAPIEKFIDAFQLRNAECCLQIGNPVAM